MFQVSGLTLVRGNLLDRILLFHSLVLLQTLWTLYNVLVLLSTVGITVFVIPARLGLSPENVSRVVRI